jgi:GT2 family glycosyltransferase
VDQPNLGPAGARNAGARTASGDFLAFIDDDCVPDPEWLSTLGTHLESLGECAVGGRTINGLAENPFAAASQLLVDYLYNYYHLQSAPKIQPPFFSSNNLALSRDTFQGVGGFNPDLATAEDRDLCARLLEAGCELYYAPDARVFHFHDLDLRSFLSQHFHYGQGNYQFHQLRARRTQEIYRLEGLGFYFGMLSYPLSKSRGVQAVQLSSLLALAQAGNISGFFNQAAMQALQK